MSRFSVKQCLVRLFCWLEGVRVLNPLVLPIIRRFPSCATCLRVCPLLLFVLLFQYVCLTFRSPASMVGMLVFSVVIRSALVSVFGGGRYAAIRECLCLSWSTILEVSRSGEGVVGSSYDFRCFLTRTAVLPPVVQSVCLSCRCCFAVEFVAWFKLCFVE